MIKNIYIIISILIILTIITLILLSFFSKYYNGNKSDHFDGTYFLDPVKNNNKNFIDFFKWQATKRNTSWPKNIEVEKYDTPPPIVKGNRLRVSNIGHTTFLIQTQGINILTDPIWENRASPFSFIGPKRIIDPGIKFENLPKIDVVWISHNHYDHLDIKTIERLWNKDKPRIITPLGNDTIIHSYNKNITVETVDWHRMLSISPQVKFHFTPMQHWSARGILDKNKALWAALTIETSGGNIYFVGDSGYGNGRYFKQDKEKFGNFRLALLPMGAYEPRWFMKYAHMNPEEMLKAYEDLGQPYTIPSHYDVFKLTDEGIGEAVEKLKIAMEERNSGENIRILKVGEFFEVPKL
ncbi:MAG TPA: MBL fold metallo-hydrolase [Candidatus Megaira endosymbiont of Hartmannula sinica]|nr:MBL fold metallo-hydrolase [Candidatus Megaera endosymbiont of Hartmannula sinica]